MERKVMWERRDKDEMLVNEKNDCLRDFEITSNMWQRPSCEKNPGTCKEEKKIAKDRKVIPDPIDDRKFQEWKESGKSGILLGITLNPRKCIGTKVRRIPINVETKW